MKSSLLKVAAVAGFVGSVVSAQAWVINLGGTYTGGANPNVISLVWENSTLFPGGFSNGTSFGYTATTNAGSSVFTDGVRTLNFDFSGINIHAGGTQSWFGTWTATSIINLNTKSEGTYTFSFDGINQWSESVVGQPVPEPASIALIGIGFATLLRRRRAR